MNRFNQPEEGSPIPPDLAAVWGAFLFEGLLVSDQQRNRSQAVLEAWNQGCIELLWQSCAYLPEIWRQVEPRWRDSVYGFPGVLEYEVISEFGTILGDHVILNDGELPGVDKARTMIRTLLTDFFSQCDTPTVPKPRT